MRITKSKNKFKPITKETEIRVKHHYPSWLETKIQTDTGKSNKSKICLGQKDRYKTEINRQTEIERQRDIEAERQKDRYKAEKNRKTEIETQRD